MLRTTGRSGCGRVVVPESRRAALRAGGWWGDHCLLDWWQLAVAASPDALAVVDRRGERLTYAEVDERSSRLAGWLVVAGVIAALGLATGKDTAALEFLFALWFGLEAIGIRRFTLERRGYTLAGVVEGVDRDAAERRFFSHWLETTPRADIRPPAVGRAAHPGDDGVIGLFPVSVAPARSGPGGHHQPM